MFRYSAMIMRHVTAPAFAIIFMSPIWRMRIFLPWNSCGKGGESGVYNLGNGNGFSVKEVIDTARKVTGHPLPANVEARRAGDPAVLSPPPIGRGRNSVGIHPRSVGQNYRRRVEMASSKPNGY